MPCAHLCVCAGCFGELQRQAARRGDPFSQCPVRRGSGPGIMRVFVSTVDAASATYSTGTEGPPIAPPWPQSGASSSAYPSGSTADRGQAASQQPAPPQPQRPPPSIFEDPRLEQGHGRQLEEALGAPAGANADPFRFYVVWRLSAQLAVPQQQDFRGLHVGRGLAAYTAIVTANGGTIGGLRWRRALSPPEAVALYFAEAARHQAPLSLRVHLW